MKNCKKKDEFEGFLGLFKGNQWIKAAEKISTDKKGRKDRKEQRKRKKIKKRKKKKKVNVYHV